MSPSGETGEKSLLMMMIQIFKRQFRKRFFTFRVSFFRPKLDCNHALTLHQDTVHAPRDGHL